MKNLYKFAVDFGRMGDLEGLFIANEDDVEELYGQTIYFGEVLGKFSDIEVEISPDMITQIDIDYSAIETLENYTGRSISGYNPFDYKEDF